MRERIAGALIALAVVLPFLFWIRGIVRGNKGDMAAGAALLAAVSIGGVAVARDSGVFSDIGCAFFLFGIATLVAGAFAKPDCPVKRNDRIAIALLFVILGFFGMMIL